MIQLDFWSGELPANNSQSQDCGKDLMTQEATLHSPMLEFLTSLDPSGAYGKMCRVSSVQDQEGILVHSSGRWSNSGMGSPTECLMLKTSESHKDAEGCLLSDVLETGNLPPRFFLSPKACLGILRRAKTRSKKLPNMLEEALQQSAQRLDKNAEAFYIPEIVDFIGFENSRRDGVRILGNVANTLQSFMGTGGNNVPCVSYGIPGNWVGRKPENGGNATTPMDNISPCLTKTDRHAVAYAFDAYNSSVTGNVTKTLDTGSDYHHVPNVYGSTMAVRRLTPVECERLQGFPDNYTYIKENCPDGHRYKALGNSMAVPVMRWIGERIKMVDQL